MAQGMNDPMQREAVRRMQEMHSRATHSNGDNGTKHEKDEQKAEAEHKSSAPSKSNGNAISDSLPLSLQQLLADKDRSLVLIIILLLLGEHSDTSLVMALVYLIL
ncbi:MAG: hypothetical protein ACI4F6_00410 [Acutalibacteraceae bacterium]